MVGTCTCTHATKADVVLLVSESGSGCVATFTYGGIELFEFVCC